LPESNGDHESSRVGGVPSKETSPPPRAADDRVVDLDVSWLVQADLGAVDALARLQVAASRCGRWLELHGADGGLVELLEFVGLGDVVHMCLGCRGACCSAANRPCAGADLRVEPPT
jgi:ABC-type transporter Mla MlaB component